MSGVRGTLAPIRRLVDRLLARRAEPAPTAPDAGATSAEAPPWPRGVPPARCEVLEGGVWRRVLVEEAITLRARGLEAPVRCLGCQGAVALYRASCAGHRAYFQHLDKDAVCQLKRPRRSRKPSVLS